MPTFSQRTLYISVSAIVLVFFTTLTLTPHPNLNTLSISSPFLRTHNQPAPQNPPQSPQNPQQQGPLSHQEQPQQPKWLLATISAYSSQRRRNIIRATWQTLYANPAFTTRFVIANPPAYWLPLITHENATYGDLIILSSLEESAAIANTIKTIEFLNHLAASTDNTPPYAFVSKIDDDSYLAASLFYRAFLLPRHPSNSTLIARRLTRPTRPFDTPGGQFYTLSWDLVALITATYASNPITTLPEDVLIGRLLYDASAVFEFVELDDSRAFDVDEELRRLGKWGEDLGPMDGAAINPHKMKDDEAYLRVAGMFGKDGFVGEGP